MDWQGRSAADLGRGIAARRIDPVELVEAVLAAAAEHEHADRIYARLMPDRARAEAEAARARTQEGLRRGPLDGVPVSWKDLFDTAGTETAAGSQLLAGRVPQADAAVLARATRAGLVAIGKTHMSELAFAGLGYNPVTATPPCINDAEAVAGGSSSGAAASVAFGLAPAAIGSDTGGSVRVPAAWNDLVGLKTTPGMLPLDGVVPLARRFDTIGPLTRSVEDAALLIAALGGPAADLRGASLTGARLLLLKTVAFDDIRPEPRAAFDSAVERLQSAGAEVARGELGFVADAMALSGPVYTGEAYGIWREAIEAAPEKMFDLVRERFRAGADVSAADYVAAWEALETHRRAWRTAVAGYDAVIVPTVPIMPPKLAHLAADADYYVRENLMTLRNTRIANLMGVPAITLPTGVPSAGIMFAAPAHGEARLLRLAAAAEAALA